MRAFIIRWLLLWFCGLVISATTATFYHHEGRQLPALIWAFNSGMCFSGLIRFAQELYWHLSTTRSEP